MENGIYKNENATFFVKDDKVIMRLKGSYYKTNENFMLAVKRVEPLSAGMINSFDRAYKGAPSW